jgi:hypothetical protein
MQTDRQQDIAGGMAEGQPGGAAPLLDRLLRPREPGGWPWAVLAGVLALLLFCIWRMSHIIVPGSDWGPLWVAGHLAWSDAASAYDFRLVSALQEPLFGPLGDRPFVYPPSALLLFAPLSQLPFMLSFAVFTLGSLALFARAARPLGPQVALMLLAPPVALAALAGQPTLFVVALVLLGLAQLDRNAVLAGVLFGIAGMIKPPLLLLAPVALAGGGYWRAFIAAGVAAGAIGLLSLALFGLDAWLTWLTVLPRFKDFVIGFPPLLRNAVTPYAMAVRLGWLPDAATALAALVAVPLAWFAFARSRDLAVRLAALVGGALLISPYAMNYELAALAPAVAAARPDKRGDVLVLSVWGTSLFATASLAGLLAGYVWLLARLFRPPALAYPSRASAAVSRVTSP